MDQLRECSLSKLEGQWVISMEGEIILQDGDIGWIKEKNSKPVYSPVTKEELTERLNNLANMLLFVETEELRHMAKTWDKPINSYSTEDPLYYEAIKLIDGKAVISFSKD
jgi:hypothetical protein